MDSEYFAHSPKEEGGEWELLAKHLKAVADSAARLAEPFGFSELGYLSGLWHDLGKYSQAFQQRLHGSNKMVDHAICGANEAITLLKDGVSLDNTVYAEILAYVIAGHHSGLPNVGTDSDRYNMSFLKARLDKECPDYSAYKKEISQDIILPPFLQQYDCYDDEQGLALSILARMIYSALVDSDSLETERNYGGKRVYSYDSFAELDARLEQKLAEFSSCEQSILNRTRAEILGKCMEKAGQWRGLYSLTVPTGGGKTLSSMAFALKHLLKNQHRRIIYVIPYTSIINQTAQLFRVIFGANNVLEHHSNVNYEDMESEDGNEEVIKKRFASENFDAPIVLTTNVQFFESLYSNKRGSCRKLHNYANSVIVFDEAQMMPIHLLKPCLKAIDILTRSFNCSALLMSATCPDYRNYLCENAKITEINDNYAKSYTDLKRVDADYLGKLTDEELIESVDVTTSNLIVVNTRRQALELFDKFPKEFNKYHLSKLMTYSHIVRTLNRIKSDLSKEARRACVVVSTQLIECGVDLDFDTVYRSLAGIDSIVQAGGRCNREGERAGAMVHIFEDLEDRAVVRELKAIQNIAREYVENPVDGDIFSLQNINSYFKDILSFRDRETDKKEILDCFVYLPRMGRKKISSLLFNFADCSKQFKYIEQEDMFDIIIPAEQSVHSLVARVKDGTATIDDYRKLGHHTVSVFKREFMSLNSASKLTHIKERMYLLNSLANYDENRGLRIEDNSIENLVY